MTGSETASRRLACFHDGWRYWLPDRALGDLLCVDDAEGRSMLALVGSCDRLTVVPTSVAAAGSLRQFAEDAALEDVTVLDGPDLARLPTTRWDGAVLHPACWGDGAVDAAMPDGLGAYLSLLRGRLGNEAFVLCSAPNRLAYRRLLGREATPPAAISGARGLRALLAGSGLAQARVWPLLMERRRITEVLDPDHGFHPLTESGSSGLRRRLLLGRPGGGWLAPAYLILASDQGLTVRAEVLAETAHPGGMIRRALVQAEKLILAVAEPGSAEPDRIVVAVRGDEPRMRQRRHAEALRAAERWPEDLSTLAPRVRRVGVVRDAEILVMDRLRGICIDEPVDDLDALAVTAVGVLERLHEATAEVAPIDGQQWETDLREPFRLAAERHPGTELLLTDIERTLRIALLGLEMPRVRVHGDFKIENLVIDPVSRELRGIIDWDLSRPSGFPMMDLLYLLTYNRLLSHGQDFERVVREVLLPDRWSPSERALRDRFLSVTGISPTVASAMPAILVVDALAYRFIYDVQRPEDRGRLFAMLESLAGRLGSAAPLAPTGTELGS